MEGNIYNVENPDIRNFAYTEESEMVSKNSLSPELFVIARIILTSSYIPLQIYYSFLLY